MDVGYFLAPKLVLGLFVSLSAFSSPQDCRLPLSSSRGKRSHSLYTVRRSVSKCCVGYLYADMEENIFWSEWTQNEDSKYNLKSASMPGWSIHVIYAQGYYVGQIAGYGIVRTSIRYRAEARATKYCEFGYRKLKEAFDALYELEGEMEGEES